MSFTKRRLSSELVFGSPDADVSRARFTVLKAREAEIKQVYRSALDSQDLPGRNAIRVAETSHAEHDRPVRALCGWYFAMPAPLTSKSSPHFPQMWVMSRRHGMGSSSHVSSAGEKLNDADFWPS